MLLFKPSAYDATEATNARWDTARNNDLSQLAVALHGQASATREQQAGVMAHIRRAAVAPAAAARLHAEVVSYAR